MSGIDDDLVRIARELCVAPQDAFAAARRDAADAAGDRSLAAAVRKLRKPVAAARIVNVFAASESDLWTDAQRLADDLRDALDAGDAKALGAVNAERRKTLRSLTDAAVAASGEEVSGAVRDAVERTLDAALRDRQAAAAVMTARLLRPIEASGMEPPDLSGAVSGPFDADDAPAPPTDELAERRAKRDAARALREAERHALAAEREAARAEERVRSEQDRVDRLERRVAELEEERRAVDADLDESRRRFDEAAVASEARRRDAARAREEADRLARED